MHTQACLAGRLQIDFLGLGQLLSGAFVRSSCWEKFLTSKLELCVQFVTCNDCLGQQQKRVREYLANL